MLLPPWPFGTAAERAAGGLQLRLLWDSVLPYSTPEAPVPVFWIPSDRDGQFQGWQRNFRQGATGAPNFPEDRHLNAVLPAMLSLKDSERAPFRMKGVNVPVNDAQFPSDGYFSEDETTGGALRFLLFYIERYCAPETRLVVPIPEREVMNVAGVNDSGSIHPRNEPPLGEASIEHFVRGLLLAHGERIVAWAGVDEPDIDARVAWYTFPEDLGGGFNLAGFVRVRRIVREAERQWRIEANLPAGFADMPPAEQDTHLLPFITTFSSRIFDDVERRPPFPTIWDFVNATDPESPGLVGIADMYFYDRYPYRRTYQEIRDDYAHCTLDADQEAGIREASITDPMRTLGDFIELRRAVNPGLKITDPGWRHVGLWNQNAGAPFRPVEPATPSSSMAPAPPPAAECGWKYAPPLPICKRFPTREELRFDAWTALLELGCGVFAFNMQDAPDDKIYTHLAPVMAEMEYFAGLRARGINQSHLMQTLILKQHTGSSFPQESLPSQAFLWQYQQAPSGQRHELWLLCVNRAPVLAHFVFVLPQINPFPGKTRAFAERRLQPAPPQHTFGTPVRVQPDGVFRTPVNPFRLRLYKMVGV